MNHTENPQAALYSALAQFQHAARVVVADRVNKGSGKRAPNKYATTPAVLEELRPLAAQYGLAIMTPPAGVGVPQIITDRNGMPDTVVSVGLRILVTHVGGGFADLGESWMLCNYNNSSSGNDKTLSAHTILKRQIWLGLAGATVVDEAPREYYQAPQDNEAEARRNAIADAQAEIISANSREELERIYRKYQPIWPASGLTAEVEKRLAEIANQTAARDEVDAMAGDNVEFA